MNRTTSAGLYRLFAWLSPGFPTGAFSYSHGLEAEIAVGAVHDRATLEAWIVAMVRHGGGRVDADLLRDACRGEGSHERGLAYRATAELLLEAAAQGEAFARTVRAAWAAGAHPPIPGSARVRRPGEGAERGEANAGRCHAVAVGEAAADVGVSLEDVLILYLQSFAANLMSAGLRLGVIGQTDGQRILAALEPVIAEAVAACIIRDPKDFGAATFAADIASMTHETQYSRLFRS